jgi:hypothetical protein
MSLDERRVWVRRHCRAIGILAAAIVAIAVGYHTFGVYRGMLDHSD